MTDTRLTRIVVIDDDDSVSEPMRGLFELHGWLTSAYTSCEAFLDDFDKANPPDCMIVDLYFPRMNGVELLRILSRQCVRIPTIVLTAWPDGSLAPSAVEAGAIEIITKPVSSDKLIQKVEAAIASADALLTIAD